MEPPPRSAIASKTAVKNYFDLISFDVMSFSVSKIKALQKKDARLTVSPSQVISGNRFQTARIKTVVGQGKENMRKDEIIKEKITNCHSEEIAQAMRSSLPNSST